MRGGARRNKSKALRDLHGSRVRPRHRNLKEPETEAGRPPKPKHLRGAASAKWGELAQLLENEKRITLSDGHWLEVTSVAYGEYIRWLKAATDAPLTIETKVGLKTHPAQQQVRLAWETYRKLLSEGGVTPMSRARVAVHSTGDDDQDDFEKFQSQGGLRLVRAAHAPR